MSDKKQLFQTQNILETLIEATDHFSQLMKEKELSQSFYIFSSIVEGSQAIIHALHTLDKDFTRETKNLEEYLILISGELEQGNFIKVSEIIQFSLRPLFVRLTGNFIETKGDQKADAEISIGIFHSSVNPKDAYPKERLQATLMEGERQHTLLHFFTSTDIDFDNKQINADTFQNNKWQRVTVPFPDVINNLGSGTPSQAERRLQRIIPFTGFFLGDKYTLPKRMLQLRKYAELLVPFTVCVSEDEVYQFMEKNDRVVFKALKSNRGENIYFITKKGSRYIMIDQKKERILSEVEFDHFVKHTILAEKNSYIIQRYVHTRTNEDEPYHFRAHVQKDHNGKWQLTHIYPRIGSKKSNLSNISTEGRVEDFPTFLKEQHGEKQGKIYEEEILKLSIDVTKHLDKLYGMVLNELGLDFAIDDTGKIWMHEANNGPQTAYHEEKRAINFISYAKYMARNGIMHTSHAHKEAVAKGQFLAVATDLPLADHPNDLCISRLVGQFSEDDLSISLAQAANNNNLSFYIFTPRDIDYDLELIRGSFYENGTWVQRVTEYPTVIIDHLKRRSATEQWIIYEELNEILFTNKWVVDATLRSTIYQLLEEDAKTGYSVATYQHVTRPLHVFQFLEKYGQVQLKQEDMDYANPFHTIHALDDGQYEVLAGSRRRLYRENELRNFINHLTEEKKYIVQQYSTRENALTEIHVIAMKDRSMKWTIFNKQVRHREILEDQSITGSTERLDDYLAEDTNTTEVSKTIEGLAMNTASVLDNKYDHLLSEISLTFVISDDNTVYLTEANPNGPRTVNNTDDYAKAVIDHAIGLAVTKDN